MFPQLGAALFSTYVMFGDLIIARHVEKAEFKILRIRSLIEEQDLDVASACCDQVPVAALGDAVIEAAEKFLEPEKRL